jgi:adenylate kinase
MKLIILGPPGSGKGMVSERLEKEFYLEHISTGELLRAEVAKGSDLGKEIAKIFDTGGYFPDDKMIRILKNYVAGKDNYVLDGFPRTLPQAQAVADLGIDAVIYLEISEGEVVKRFSGRRMCKNNHGYNIKSLPPKRKGICDIDGLPLEIREDDQPEVVKERFVIYNEKTRPLIEYYKKKGLLRTVDAATPPDVEYRLVKEVLGMK